MVMKRNAMRKNLRQSIKRSLGRYLAIVAIIALGASMFVGLLMTKSDMVATGQKFMDEQNMFDLRLMNAYGWTQENLDAVKQLPGPVDVEGILYTDLIVRLNDNTDDQVYRFYAMPEKINLFSLRGGRMPEARDECLIDGYHMDDSVLGTTITVSPTNSEDAADAVKTKTYTVVGYFASPLYMDMNRGTTSVGSGSLSNYIYIPAENFDLDYYAEIHVTIPGEYDIYSEEYNAAMEAMADELEPLLQPYADARLKAVKQEAKDAYYDGLNEFKKGLLEFQDGKNTAQKELADAQQQLLDAEQQLLDGEKQLESGRAQLNSARAQLRQGEAELAEGKQQFEQMKSLLLTPLENTVTTMKASMEASQLEKVRIQAKIADLEVQSQKISDSISAEHAKLTELNGEISQLDASIARVNAGLYAAQSTRDILSFMPDLNAQLIAELDSRIAALNTQKTEYTSRREELVSQRDKLQNQIGAPLEQIEEIQNQIQDHEREISALDLTIAGIQASLVTAEESLQQTQQQLSDAEAEVLAGEEQLRDGWNQIYASERQLLNAEKELADGRQELEQGWVEYEEGKAEAEAELAEAEAELLDAKAQLDDAWELIESMTSNDVIILDRNSNIGYNSLDSASDIVSGVSRVFPAFFLAVAAMVCITTMTRMIDEERTQIGTLKALGYSNGAIISKYLIYAGSGAVIGCGLGVLIGSAVFPTILWQAYKIMLYITDDIVLQINWPLCAIVVGTYTVVMLLVTWYCCRRTLKEVPAELIRPKSPDPGKKILMEKLPFWHKISFLNKVTIRNIFRYRQRLAMMMLGIGGCTALLVTGYGLRDSIVNVVDYQFEEVTTYDMSVYFSGGLTQEERQEFLDDIAFGSENACFYHQSSIDLDHNNRVKEIYLISGSERITEFIDLHTGEDAIAMPGLDEAVLSVGVAEALGISVGDEIHMRNADLQEVDVTVSGIYDNHVYNYVIIAPETIRSQWGELPEEQMAFVKVKQGQDAHALSAEITGMANVMNVSVSEDLADMVGNMMEALDLVVWVIVFCAGLLAAIVLYNLTNININERIREIATIKVLGFNAQETAMYVFKENLSLTAVGSVLGLGLGYLLLLFVMSQIKIDMVWFKAIVMPVSYLISIALTILSAIVVDFIFYFKLDKINMAEALKSVE